MTLARIALRILSIPVLIVLGPPLIVLLLIAYALADPIDKLPGEA